MTKTIPVIAWQQTGYDTLNFSFVCDSSLDTMYNFNLFGTDPSGGGNSESDVKATVVVVDNFLNNSTPQITFGGSTFNIAPYARKSFPIRKDQKYLSLRVSLGSVILTFANYDIGIPDDINQYAQSTGQIISSTTLDPAQTNAAIILSGGNLVGTVSSNAGVNSQCTVGKNAGKLYFEVTHNVVSGGGQEAIGIIPKNSLTTASPLTEPVGSGYRVTGLVYVNSAIVGAAQAWNAGDTLRCAVNITAGLIWFSKVGQLWNNNALADPATGVGGYAINAGVNYVACIYPSTAAGAPNDQMTANFGGSPFLKPVPAGYTGWF